MSSPTPTAEDSVTTPVVGISVSDNQRPATITAEVYENQRWFPLSKWSSTKRLPTDRPLFSNKSGTDELDMDNYRLPPGYAWGSPVVESGGAGAASSSSASPSTIKAVVSNQWVLEIDYPNRTDKEGWRYSVDYKAHFAKEMTATSLVRRRRYTRTAIFMGEGNGSSPLGGDMMGVFDNSAGGDGDGFLLVSKTPKGNVTTQSGAVDESHRRYKNNNSSHQQEAFDPFEYADTVSPLVGGGFYKREQQKQLEQQKQQQQQGGQSAVTTTAAKATTAAPPPSSAAAPVKTAILPPSQQQQQQQVAKRDLAPSAASAATTAAAAVHNQNSHQPAPAPPKEQQTTPSHATNPLATATTAPSAVATATAATAQVDSDDDEDMKYYFTSPEARRQARAAAKANKAREETAAREKERYFPKDNSCAAAALKGDDFALPNSFEVAKGVGGGGSGEKSSGAGADYSRGNGADFTNPFDSATRDRAAPFSMAGNHNSVGISTAAATFSVPSAMFASPKDDAEQQESEFTIPAPAALTTTTENHNSSFCVPPASAASAANMKDAGNGVVVTSESAAQFDDVFSAFVAKAKGV